LVVSKCVQIMIMFPFCMWFTGMYAHHHVKVVVQNWPDLTSCPVNGTSLVHVVKRKLKMEMKCPVEECGEEIRLEEWVIDSVALENR